MNAETSVLTREQVPQPNGAERARSRPVFRPNVDIIDTEDAILLVADMPGVAENDADILLEKNVLTITGTIQAAGRAGDACDWFEYEEGDYERTFTISNEIDREGIEASLKDGVLRVRLPKAKHATLKKIAVKSG